MSRARGRVGESIAARALAARGYQILEANYTCRLGEIDLVCRHAAVLVFVEVRSRATDEHGLPEETVGRVKQQRLQRAAQHYLTTHGLDDADCRFDVVAIVGDEITVYEDAFQ